MTAKRTFTIERSYDVPHFRHVTYEAASLEEALKLDEQNDDWNESSATEPFNGFDDRVTGAWEGPEADEGDNIAPEIDGEAGRLRAALVRVKKIAKAALAG